MTCRAKSRRAAVGSSGPVVLGGGVPATRSLGVARVIVRSNRPKRRLLIRLPNGHPRRIRWAAHANADADMPSQAMQDLIDAFRDRQEASASQAPPTLEERRAAFAPGGRLHPVPDAVLVKDVTAGGVTAG